MTIVAEEATVRIEKATNGLEHAFKPIEDNTDWNRSASYMLMLRDLSDLTQLENFIVPINAKDHIMQQYDYMSAHMLDAPFALANIYAFDQL